MKLPELSTHPKGELSKPTKKNNYLSDSTKNSDRLPVETFGGRVHVEWDPESSVTPLGQLAFFIEFLKMGNLLGFCRRKFEILLEFLNFFEFDDA
jgi:hypothetical protein